MGVFDFFFSSSKDTSSSSSNSTTVSVSHSKPGSETVKYDAKGAPIFKDNKVLAINDNKDDDFIQVDIRKLSYAEVAALSAAKNSVNNNKKPAPKDNMKVVDVNQDLGTDITDYQLAEAIQKQIDARDLKEAIAAQQNRFTQSGASTDDLMDFADKFDTKIASSKQTKKHKKHSRKNKIKLAQHTFINL